MSEEQKILILNKTFERGSQEIIKDFFKCHLYEIILSFFIFDYNFIQNFLISTGQFDKIIDHILEVADILKYPYDKKVKKQYILIFFYLYINL